MNQKLEEVFNKYVQGTANPEETEELMQMVEEGANRDDLQELLTRTIPAIEPAFDLPEQAAKDILASILNVEEMKDQDPPVQPVPVRRMPPWRWVAAAAVVFIVFSLLFLMERKPEAGSQKLEIAVVNDVEAPKESRAVITLADGRKVLLDSLTSLTQAQVSVVRTAEGVIAYSGSASEMVYNTLSNPRGSKVVSLTLSDGTKVWLNAESSLRYPVAFVGKERNVEITGEAYFEVRHDAGKPFVVRKGEVTVQVLGTHFNVNAYHDEEGLRVTLLEGRVKVSNRREAVILRPGQQASQAPNLELRTLNNVDVDEVMAWKNGLFSFKNAGLQMILNEAARWYDVDVVYEGPLPAVQFSGEIGRGLTLTQFLSVLEETRIHYKLEGRKLTIRP